MNKGSTGILKKLTKPLVAISTIAILLMDFISGLPIMKSSALDPGLISRDINSGNIDTNSLFSCVYAAVTCINENENNNDEITNNEITPVPPCGYCTTISYKYCKLCFR